MLLDLIAAAAAAFGAAGVAMVLRHLTRGRLPRWIVPLAAGAGMIAFAIWNEYTWYPRVAATLPAEVPVVLAPADTSPLRPWTYAVPLVTRFIALDRTAMVTSTENPAIRRADAMVVERWMGTKRIPMGFDCAGGRQATLGEGVTLAPDGTLEGAAWAEVGPEDELQKAACREG
ncbi:MAG TPA: hypothetical protein PKD10_10805 [Paracoccaceae bacterium]|nr:hypothetical protein [Paracoccaceae bacterium]HMO72795.1 hypothetical protein [Paracoccaceae bacterium]